MLDLRAQTEEILLPGGDEWILRVKEKAFGNMKRHDGCAQVIVDAFMQEWLPILALSRWMSSCPGTAIGKIPSRPSSMFSLPISNPRTIMPAA